MSARRKAAPAGSKWCNRTQRHWPLSEFHRDRRATDGLQSYSREGKRLHKLTQYDIRARSAGLMPGDKCIYVQGATRTCVEVKIGFSHNPWQRRAALTNVMGLDLQPLDVYRIPAHVSNKQIWHIEHDLFKKIEKAGYYRKHGSEVFARSAFEARALRKYVQRYASRQGWQKLNVR